jgi:hypothetical protein
MDSTAFTSLAGLWDEIFGSQPDPDLWVVIATLVAALAVIVPHPLWRLSRNAITIAHEGGHGLVALLTGRTLTGIRLHSDTSGLTVSRGKPHGLGMILTAAFGYTAPPLLGLGGAAMLAAGHITALLWLATALLLAMASARGGQLAAGVWMAVRLPCCMATAPMRCWCLHASTAAAWRCSSSIATSWASRAHHGAATMAGGRQALVSRPWPCRTTHGSAAPIWSMRCGRRESLRSRPKPSAQWRWRWI